MKLVLYSGGQSRQNYKLHEALVRLARKDQKRTRKLKLTYIPYCSEHSSVFYNRAVKRYQKHGIENFQCLNVDHPFQLNEVEQAMESDIIYLAGGNTFYFLKHLRESGVLARLKTFAQEGGVLAGLSAGGLIMSPTVKLAADSGLGPDENEVNLKNFTGMKLFGFEFSPHFENSPKQIKAHIAYSEKTKNPVYAVPDGSGIIIDGTETEIIGKTTLFHRGEYRTLK